MTRSGTTVASTLFWNAVLPALGLALILGVALVPAVLVAGGVALAIYAVATPGHAVPRRALRGS